MSVCLFLSDLLVHLENALAWIYVAEGHSNCSPSRDEGTHSRCWGRIQVSFQFTPKFLSKCFLQRLSALVPDWREDGSQLPVRWVGGSGEPPKAGALVETLQPPCCPLSCPAYDNFKLSPLEGLRNEPSFLPRAIKKPGEIDVALSCRTEEVQTNEFLCLLPLNSTH